MTFTCPFCNLDLESDGDVLPGQKVECPYCGETFTIQDEPAGPGDSSPVSENGEEVQPIVITTVRKGPGDEGTDSSLPPRNPGDPLLVTHSAISAALQSQRDSKRKRKSSKRWIFWGAGVAAVIGIAGLGAWMGGGSESSPPTTTRYVPRSMPRSAPPTTTRPPRVFSGPRAHVKRYIDTHGDTCRVVSLTKLGGDVVICNRNDWASSGCPQALNNVLDRIADEGGRITDVTLTESGRWLVLYDRNAAQWFNIPYRMEQAIREYNRDNEVIYSATFNDAGDWIIITDKHYRSSAGFITDWLRGGERKYGELRSACICGGDAVAVFDRGFLFWGNVTDDLKKALRETDLDVRIIKLAGPAWFFADVYGSYQYNM